MEGGRKGTRTPFDAVLCSLEGVLQGVGVTVAFLRASGPSRAEGAEGAEGAGGA
jgi:hypothetical protein